MKAIQVTDWELSILCCLNSAVPQPPDLISVDTGLPIDDVNSMIRVSRGNGWPVEGTPSRGYVLAFERRKNGKGLKTSHNQMLTTLNEYWDRTAVRG